MYSRDSSSGFLRPTSAFPWPARLRPDERIVHYRLTVSTHPYARFRHSSMNIVVNYFRAANNDVKAWRRLIRLLNLGFERVSIVVMCLKTCLLDSDLGELWHWLFRLWRWRTKYGISIYFNFFFFIYCDTINSKHVDESVIRFQNNNPSSYSFFSHVGLHFSLMAAVPLTRI